jgi:hypothetical protein
VIVSENGCPDTSDCYIIQTVGLPNEGTTSSINVYPNPGTGLFTISATADMENAELTVYNVRGQTLSQQKVSAGHSVMLDITGRDAGVYILELRLNGQLYRARIIKTNN